MPVGLCLDTCSAKFPWKKFSLSQKFLAICRRLTLHWHLVIRIFSTLLVPSLLRNILITVLILMEADTTLIHLVIHIFSTLLVLSLLIFMLNNSSDFDGEIRVDMMMFGSFLFFQLFFTAFKVKLQDLSAMRQGKYSFLLWLLKVCCDCMLEISNIC